MSNSRSRILLIDDDSDIRDVIVEKFRNRNFEFVLFGDPQEPLSHVAKDPQYFSNFSLIVTDFKMPSMDGIEFIREVRKYTKEIPIVIMTSTNRVEVAVEAIKAGAYDFVVKPLDFGQFEVSIDRALDAGKLRRENQILRTTLNSPWSVEGVIGKSQSLKNVIDLSKRVANSTANILIQGESGTGKEVIAKLIHQQGARAQSPFIPINCSAIPEALMESELFGHAKGAFTGAADKKIGLFEEAEGGTVFLDEIGDLPLSLQAKLLRVLQERKIKRIGENAERPINVRLIAASHKDLAKEFKEKRFREDLYFRLNVIEICIPPLRERREDILPLAEHFFKKFKIQNESTLQGISRDALDHLIRLPWQGNVRELENTIERAVVLGRGPLIEIGDLSSLGNENPQRAPQNNDVQSAINFSEEAGSIAKILDISMNGERILSLDEMSRLYVALVLKKVGGVKERAARVLEIDRKTLYRKLADGKVENENKDQKALSKGEGRFGRDQPSVN